MTKKSVNVVIARLRTRPVFRSMLATVQNREWKAMRMDGVLLEVAEHGGRGPIYDCGYALPSSYTGTKGHMAKLLDQVIDDCHCDILVIVDDDAKITKPKEFIHKLRTVYDKEPTAGMVVPLASVQQFYEFRAKGKRVPKYRIRNGRPLGGDGLQSYRMLMFRSLQNSWKYNVLGELDYYGDPFLALLMMCYGWDRYEAVLPYTHTPSHRLRGTKPSIRAMKEYCQVIKKDWAKIIDAIVRTKGSSGKDLVREAELRRDSLLRTAEKKLKEVEDGNRNRS